MTTLPAMRDRTPGRRCTTQPNGRIVGRVHTASARATGSYVRRIPAVTPRSPGNARAWATGITAALGYDPDMVALAVSEFVTNVLRYAAGPAEIVLRPGNGVIEVACSDRHPETAAAVHPRDEADGITGRGLFILAMLATDGVHVDTAAGRKRVAVHLPIGEAA